MTCKDCYFSNHWRCGFVDDVEFSSDERKCFKDKSLIVELPLKLSDTVDKLFSHNEIVALHYNCKEENCHYRLWKGMAWDIPEQYKAMPFVKIFGCIAESIYNSDIINIEIDVPKAKAENAKMDGEKE